MSDVEPGDENDKRIHGSICKSAKNTEYIAAYGILPHPISYITLKTSALAAVFDQVIQC